MNVEVTFLPSGRKAVVRAGTSVLDASRRARVDIRTRCGGKAGCLMCKVTHDGGSGLAAMTEAERRKLAGLEGTGTRLSCQARVTGNVTVTVPDDPLKTHVRNLLARQKEEEEGLW